MPYYRLQILPELLHRSKYTVLSRIRPGAKRRADLLNRQPLKVAQDEGRSFLRAQFVQCRVYPIAHLGTVCDPLRSRRIHRDGLQDVAFLIRTSLAFVLVTLAHANQVQRIVRRDAEQPRREAGARFVSVKLLVCPQESLLHHVLCVLFISSHTKSQSEDGSAVLLDEQSKGVAVAGPRPFDRAARFHFHPAFRLLIFVTVRAAVP